MAPPHAWYAVHTRSRCEKLVDRLLGQKGLETFLPLATRRSRMSLRRFRDAQVPLFPGYVFLKLCGGSDYQRARRTAGVARIVGTPEGPVAVPEREIEALRRLAAAGFARSAESRMAPGRRVMVVRGPLRGVEGEVIRRKLRSLFVIKVELIQRQVLVDLDGQDLELAPLE